MMLQQPRCNMSTRLAAPHQLQLGAARGRHPARYHLVAATAAGSSSGGGAPAALAGLPADVASLTLEEVEQTLQCRELSTEGSPSQLQQRLASFLADPTAFPHANCRPRPVALLGGRLFGSQQQLRRHVQMLLELLQRDVVEEGHPDYPFLLELLQLHPRYTQKVSHPPVLAFRVRVVEEMDQAPIRCFEYMDGRQQWDDFSYRKCIGLNPEHNAHLTFRDAMRVGVWEQLEAYRLASAATSASGRQVYQCDCCGRRVPDPRKLRIEHVQPSFNQLIKDFAATTTLTPPPVDGRLPGSNRGCFTDEAWLAAWRRYHRQNVRQMQLLCMGCIKQRKQQEAREQEEAWGQQMQMQGQQGLGQGLGPLPWQTQPGQPGDGPAAGTAPAAAAAASSQEVAAWLQ